MATVPRYDVLQRSYDSLVLSSRRKDRRISRLQEALDGCYRVLARVRYTNWPTRGLGIGLNAEDLDEVMMEADRLLPPEPEAPKEKKSSKKLPAAARS